jgi:hypothetical protein
MLSNCWPNKASSSLKSAKLPASPNGLGEALFALRLLLVATTFDDGAAKKGFDELRLKKKFPLKFRSIRIGNFKRRRGSGLFFTSR